MYYGGREEIIRVEMRDVGCVATAIPEQCAIILTLDGALTNEKEA